MISRRVTTWSILSGMAATVIFLVPANYTVLSGSATTAYRLAVAVGVLILLVQLLPGNSVPGVRRSRLSVLALILIAMFAAGTVDEFPNNLTTLAPLAIGLSAGLASQNSRRARLFLIWLAISLCAALIVDLIAGRYIVHEAFGTPLRSSGNWADFRARGFVGQPVPAAAICISLSLFGFLLVDRSTHRRPILLRSGTIVFGLSAAFLTGTRSAFLVLLACLAIVFAASVGRSRSLSPPAFFSFLVAAFVGVALVPLVSLDRLGRIADFGTLKTSESYSNRLRAFDTLSSWSSEPIATIIFGHGGRDLQSVLLGGTLNNGISTVDNLFVTLLWDFGLVGALALVLALVYALRSVFRTDATLWERAAGMGLVSLGLSSAFFDSLYSAPIAVLFGFYWASLCVSEEVRGLRPKPRHMPPSVPTP